MAQRGIRDLNGIGDFAAVALRGLRAVYKAGGVLVVHVIREAVAEAGEGGGRLFAERELGVAFRGHRGDGGVRAGLHGEGELRDGGFGGDGVKGRVGNGYGAVGGVYAVMRKAGGCAHIGKGVGVVGDGDLAVVGGFFLVKRYGHAALGVGSTGSGGVNGSVGAENLRADGVQAAGGTVRGRGGRGTFLRVLLRFGCDAGSDGVCHQFVAGDRESFKRGVRFGRFVFVSHGGRRSGAIYVKAGYRPYILIKRTRVVYGAGGGIDNDDFGVIAVRVCPVDVGSVVIQVLIQEGCCNAGIRDQRGRAEGHAVADAHLRLPDLAVFIQEVEGRGGGADLSCAERDGVCVSDVGFRKIQQTVGQTGERAVFILFRRKVAEDDVGGEGIYEVTRVLCGRARQIERHYVVLTVFGQVVGAAVHGIEHRGFRVYIQRTGIEIACRSHVCRIQIHRFRFLVSLRPCRKRTGAEARKILAALFVPDDAVQVLVDVYHGNGAGGGDSAVAVCCGNDIAAAGGNGGHHAVFIHGGDRGIAGRPRNGAVGGRQRQDLCAEDGGGALVKFKRRGGDLHGGDGAGIDGFGNVVFYKQIHAVGRRGAGKRVIAVSYVISAVAGTVAETVVCAVKGKVRGCRGCVRGERNVVPAGGKIIVAVLQGYAGAVCRSREHGVGVHFLDGHHAAVIDNGNGRPALGSVGMGEGVAGARGVGVNDQVVFVRLQRIGEPVDRSVDHDGAAVQRYGDGGLVGRVVGNEDRKRVFRRGEGIGKFLAGGGLLGHHVDVCRFAGGVHHAQVGHVQVIAEGQCNGAVVVEHRRADLGFGIIQRRGVADVGALTVVAGGQDVLELRARQGARLDVAGGLTDIILGEGEEAEGEFFAFRKAEGTDVAVHVGTGGGRGLPRGRGGLGVIVGSVGVGGGRTRVQQGAVLFYGCESTAGGGPDQVITHLIQQRVVAQRQTVRREGGFLHVRVARVPRIFGRTVVADLPAVGVGSAEVGGLVGAVEALLVTYGVVHGGVRPGAVEADHRDGIGYVVLGFDEGVRLKVGAARALGVKRGLLRFGQLDGNGYGAHAARGHDLGLHAGLSGTDPGKQRVSVAAGDAFFAVEFGGFKIVFRAVGSTGNVGKDRVGVRLVGVAVFIHVRGEFDGSGVVPCVAHVCGKRRGGMLHQRFIGGEGLREHVGTQRVFHVLFGVVVDFKAVSVNAGAGGIVADFRFYLVVVRGDRGVGAHLDVALRVHGALQIGKARALLQDGVVIAGCRFLHRHGGGHQTADGEVPRGKAGFFGDAVIVVELAHCGGKAGDLRGRHGGTAHQLVLIVAALIGIFGGLTLMVTVQGEHAAAGRSDLGLQCQRAGHAPGREVAHLVVVARYGLSLAVDFKGAGVVIDVVGGLTVVGSLDLVAHVQLDARYGSGIGVAVHGGAGHTAGLVVYNDQGDGAGFHGGVGLHIEVGGTAVAHRHLALNQAFQRVELVGAGAVGFVVTRVTCAVQINELVGAGNVDQVGLGAARHIVIVRGDIAEVEEGNGGAGVVHGRHGKGVHEGTGAAAGHQVDVVGIQLLLAVPGIVIAHGNAKSQFRILQVVHNGLVRRCRIRGAGIGGTQRQVRAGGAQTDGVFHGGKVIGIVSAAAGAEHLHHEELRIGRFAHDAHGLGRGNKVGAALQVAVGRRDAAHVGAVLALLVADVVDGGVVIHIVVGEGQLSGKIHAVSAVQGGLDGVHLGLGEQIVGGAVGGLVLFDGVHECVAVHGLVVGIKAGIDDGKPGARARVLGGVAGIGTHHIAGVVHHGRIGFARNGLAGSVLIFNLYALNAGDRPDFNDIAVTDVGGNGVCEKR